MRTINVLKLSLRSIIEVKKHTALQIQWFFGLNYHWSLRMCCIQVLLLLIKTCSSFIIRNNQCDEFDRVLMKTILFVWEKHNGEEDTHCNLHIWICSGLLCPVFFCCCCFFSSSPVFQHRADIRISSSWTGTCLNLLCTTEALWS